MLLLDHVANLGSIKTQSSKYHLTLFDQIKHTDVSFSRIHIDPLGVSGYIIYWRLSNNDDDMKIGAVQVMKAMVGETNKSLCFRGFIENRWTELSWT